MHINYDPILSEPFGYGYLSHMEEGPYCARGAGLYEECKVLPIAYDKEVGLFRCGRVFCAVGIHYDIGTYYSEELIVQKKEKYPEYSEFLDMLKQYTEPLSTEFRVRDLMDPMDLKVSDAGAGWGGGAGGGHTIPDYGGLLALGTSGLRAKINRYRKVNPHAEDFYNGLEKMLDGFEVIGDRIKAMAETMAAETEDEGEKKHLLDIARAMETCPRNTPYDFLSAAQFFWLYFSYDGFDSPGRLDQIFLPYWKKTPYDEAFAILDGMWQGFRKFRAWNMCISGSDEKGNDMTNEISFAMLELVKKYRYSTPNLTMRWHENTDPALMRSAAEAIGMGCGLPALYNDKAVCRMFIDELGIPPKDAHDYAMNGCNQIDIQGKSHMGLEDGEVNLYKCLEFMLHRGKCQISGEKLTMDCGDPCSFATFEELLAAYKKEVEYVTNVICRMANVTQQGHGETAQNPWRSIMHQGCIEKGRDFKCGGPLYNHGQILIEGLADTVDSLAAIRYHVYEQKNFTMAQLIHALETDFAEDEVMRQMLAEKPARFGNNDPSSDALAKDITDHFFRYLLTIPTYRGGRYTGGCSTFVRAPGYGIHTGAGANGRHRGDPLIADSIGATPGRDENGPTALLNSVLALPHHLAGSGFVLNIKFDRTLFNTEEGINNFLALWKTFFENGGQQLSVTVVSAEDLLDAKVHPENHRNLIVRVGGYSDHFVKLSADLQDNVIARTGYAN
ncbi:MAG: hypothetical protein E7658_00675 [Ruminococcaceae bacterium]|nr:hypothetical protein [Oscillospiraceae bacterium]